MALGPKPTLTEIKAELSSASNALSDFIVEAGQFGVWDRQSDFANYTHGTFSMAPNVLFFDDSGIPSQNITITASGAWTLTASDSWVNPSTLSGSGNDTVGVTCNVNISTERAGDVSGELDSNPLINDSVIINQSGI